MTKCDSFFASFLYIAYTPTPNKIKYLSDIKDIKKAPQPITSEVLCHLSYGGISMISIPYRVQIFDPCPALLKAALNALSTL